jgi:hypothetical protein
LKGCGKGILKINSTDVKTKQTTLRVPSQRYFIWSEVVVHVCNPSTWETRDGSITNLSPAWATWKEPVSKKRKKKKVLSVIICNLTTGHHLLMKRCLNLLAKSETWSLRSKP